jgi:hypothetical protein
MHFLWQPELLDEALSTLTPVERNALLVSTTIKTPKCLKNLSRNGFDSLAAFETALESAKSKARTKLAELGINHFHDLDFEEPGTSAEGKLLRSMKGRSTD